LEIKKRLPSFVAPNISFMTTKKSQSTKVEKKPRSYKELLKAIRAGSGLSKEEWLRVNYHDMPERLQLRVQELMLEEFPVFMRSERIRSLYFDGYLLSKRDNSVRAKSTLRSIRMSLNRLMIITSPYASDESWVLHHIELAISNGWLTFYRDQYTYVEFKRVFRALESLNLSEFPIAPSFCSWYGYAYDSVDFARYNELISRGRLDDLYAAHKMLRRMPDGQTAPWSWAVSDSVVDATIHSRILKDKESEIINYVENHLPQEFRLNAISELMMNLGLEAIREEDKDD